MWQAQQCGTKLRQSAVAILGAWFLAGTLSAQNEKSVDFRRDVLPLIRQNCVVCHGPGKQMNNFRLDRRSMAMRGGTRSVIVPGSSASSRLYLRLIGTEFGEQMPPTGPLSAEAAGVFKAWIDQGAEWPDDLAGEVDLPPADAKAVKMAEAMRSGDLATFQKFVAEDPKSLNLRGPDGSTPFMFAVLYGDAATVSKLIEKGGQVNQRNDAQATALMWAATNFEKARLLLEHGADVNTRSNDGRTALSIAATKAGTAPIVKLLLEHGAKANPAGTTDSVPLRQAAAAADYEVMKLLIDHGANIRAAGAEALEGPLEADCQKCIELVEKNVNAKEYSTALLALSIHSERVKAIRFLLDHGANVNVEDVDGRTPILFAANSDYQTLETVKLLIDHGADVNAKNHFGQSPLYLAKLHGNTPIVSLLLKSGAKADKDPAPVLKVRKDNTIQEAVQRALPLIQRADLNFMKSSGCTSCHNEGLTDMALSVARQAGYRVDEQMAEQELKAVTNFWEGWRDRLLQGVAPGGPAYTLVGMHAEKYTPDGTTDAIARYIQMKQFPDGHWAYGCGGSRAPLCGAEISNTALSMRSLQFYAPNADKAEYQKSIQLAGDWLAKAEARTNEDLTFRVLGLAWARQEAGESRGALQKAVKDLIASQRSDGGWSDIPSMSSTAFATGEAMVALHESGLAVSDPAYQRGVRFLLSTQLEDGSWYIKSHSQAVQPYFDVGFPHDRDQWISAAGTSWATMALALASPIPHAPKGDRTSGGLQ